MGITSLHRVHWISIALIVGLALGWASDSADSGLWGADVAGHGLLLPDQEAFENGLIQEFQGMRLFRDAIVYPQRLAQHGGKDQRVYLVSGRFWNGQEHLRDGRPVAEWVRRCVITSTPYRPRVAGRDPSIAAEYPSVIEFLQAMHRAHEVEYRYAWWAAHPVLTWLVGVLILIGGVWPTLINLIAFGRLTRPPEAKTLSLWNVHARKGPPVRPAAASFTLPPHAEPYESVLPPDPAVADDESPPAPVVALSGGPIEAITKSPRESKEFGADQDDFYPTERHRARGFSLVEVLTLIGIVAVLVALLFPALRVARESANRAKCAAQLRQIGVAFALYANANRGWLPAWSSGWKTWPSGQPEDTPGPAWTIELIPYIGNPDSPVHNCPSFPARYRTYFIEALWAYVNGHDATKLSSITRSSEFVLSGDITQILAYPYPFGGNDHTTNDADFSDEYGLMLMFPDQGGFLMHRGGDNVLFADSHVDTFDAFDPARITFHPNQMRSWDQVRRGGPD